MVLGTLSSPAEDLSVHCAGRAARFDDLAAASLKLAILEVVRQ